MKSNRKAFKQTSLAVAAALALGPFAVLPASAATCSWNTGAGNWAALANWAACVAGNGNPAGVPGAADSATIGASGVVTVNTAQSILNLNNAGRINIDAASLTLQGGGSTNNTGGVIGIANGSALNQSGQSITGGTINTTGTGALRVNGSSANFLNGVTLGGRMDMASAFGLQRITNGLTLNSGTIDIGSQSVLSFEGTGTLAGTGNIVFGAGPNNRLYLDGNGTTTFAAGTTVRGHSGALGGQINIGGTQTLVNNGSISADVAGGTITIFESAVTNNGTLSALNGGTLVLSSNVAGGASGQIVAGAGSTVLQSGIVISGTVNTSGSGQFRASGSSANFLNGVTLNGNLDMASAFALERVTAGGLVLNGAINVGSQSVLSFEGDGGLSGNGSIVLGTGPNNRIFLDGNGTTTFAAGTTVRGENGVIGSQINIGGTQTLVNNGSISADVAGGTITIFESAVTNNGTLSALNGGTLVLSSNVTGNLGGQIVAGAGSTVLQSGIVISGTVNTSGSGQFRASGSSANFLNGVTLNGNLDMASAFALERVTAGGLVLNGTINVGSQSVLSFEGDGGLSGNGSIVLGTGPNNRIYLDGNGTTTLAAGTTVRGHSGALGGQINIGGTQTLVNNGSISADVAGGTITIFESAVTNNGTLSALNGGTLVLSSNVAGGASGQIVAGAGSTVLQSGIVISGTVNTSGSGQFRASGSSANFLNGVTLNGNLDMASAFALERVTAGGLVLNGAINVGSQSVLSFEGDGGLSGNGSIVLGTGPNNRIFLDGNGTTTFAAGTTVRGHSGDIGGQINIGGTQTLVNNGSIVAELAGGTINFTDSALVNNGLLRAQAGAMNVNVPLTGTGTLLVDATGAMILAAGAKSQGVLAMGATGAALNLNSGNLTIGSDYTNAAAGTGNSFNKRAGVSGTGQIVAGGNATQAITGSGIGNGNTANATLTLGNVRVGATTFDYQIANIGTTGPSLRGAIQTNVNGANLSDARLTGAGATASNYNTGAPGSNTGNLGVTFTAASAGALSPLAGQVLNLTSNFSNIADQKLNIVLGAGAAAYNAAVGNAASPVQVANQRVGGGNTATVAVSNTAAVGAFSEDLNASVGGTSGATGSGSIAGRLAGASSGGGAITVGVNTTAAGAQTGTVTLNYQTAGAVNGVSNGLGIANVGTQVVTVNGNVYQAATGALQSAPLNFGTVQVGQSVSQSLVVRNTATGVAGFVEDLNASFGAASGTGAGLIGGSGALNGILAGANSNAGNGAMTVNVNTGAAGVVNGSIAINYTSAGAVNGVSNGLGTLGVGSENYGVAGTIQAVANVINQASPQINNAVINLGNVRVNAASPTQAVSISNLATVAPQAALNATVSANAPITATGSFNLLGPGATNNSAIVVGMQTANAGANIGTATVSFVSDAGNVGNCAPNCQLNLASQSVTVTGNVFRLASPTVNTPSVALAARVGDAAPTAQINLTNTSPDAFTERLNASVGSVAPGFTGSGSVIGLTAGASSSALVVALNTGTAGSFGGTAALNFASSGAGTTGAADAALANGSVALAGKVYTAAVAQLNTSVVDFGIVHRGDAVSARNVSVSNAAAATALNDGLKASLGGASGPFIASGSVASVAAQASDAVNLTVGLSTASSGIFNGSAAVSFASHNTEMADLSLAAGNVTLLGQVNEFAQVAVGKLAGAGALSGAANAVTLDFGTILLGANDLNAVLGVFNAAIGLADFLDGSFSFGAGGAGSAFSFSGFNPFGGLAAGDHAGGFSIDFDSAALGTFSQTITLSSFGSNASGFRGALADTTLILRGTVANANPNAVPEPATATVVFSGLLALWATRRRTQRRSQGRELHNGRV